MISNYKHLRYVPVIRFHTNIFITINYFILDLIATKCKDNPVRPHFGPIDIETLSTTNLLKNLSQLMRLWYLSHRRPAAKAQASLRAVSSEPSLVAHMKYGSRRRVRPKISPTGWLHMRVWRMSLRRTKSAIISWADSNVFSKHWYLL